MKNLAELFWHASLEEIKQGYVYHPPSEEYTCLVCGRTFSQGEIYPDGKHLYEAKKYVKLHIGHEHTSMFDYLLEMNKKYTGLTDLQKNLLRSFYQGCGDNEIVKRTGSSPSTIRNHRFALREKEKQAKVFLAIMELLSSKSGKQENKEEKLIDFHREAKMIDTRFAITEQENEQVLKAYFKEGPDGPLSSFPIKQKRKVIILRHIAKLFSPGKQYTEKEVNEILKRVYPDHVTIRRYLIEYGFLDRKADGSAYWIRN